MEINSWQLYLILLGMGITRVNGRHLSSSMFDELKENEKGMSE